MSQRQIISPDGEWWWDGQSWRPVAEQAPAQAADDSADPPLARMVNGAVRGLLLSPPMRWYGNGRRAFYGLLWTFYTALLLVAGFHFLTQIGAPPAIDALGVAHPNDSGGDAITWLIAWAAATLTGVYSWRIWTWRARRLWLLIVI